MLSKTLFSTYRRFAVARFGTATTAKSGIAQLNLFNPTDEHQALREMLRSFVESEVDPQALEFNRKEKFNVDLFRKLGGLGLLGITVETEYGGSGMDAVAAVIAHGTLLILLYSMTCFRGTLRCRSCILFILPCTCNAFCQQFKSKWKP